MFEKLKNFDFIGHRKIYYIVCIVVIVASIGIGAIRGYNFGLDFTGGTLMEVEMGKEVKIGDVEDVLNSVKIDGTVTHAGEKNTQVIIKTNSSLESEDRVSLLDALKEKFKIKDDAVLSVQNIGPSVGDLLKKSAFKAIVIAVLLMLIYIAVRFQWRYGVAAILALANTLLIVFGFYGLFHITINSPFIAAMLTILGYGINDTIVIFDRIRENTGDSGRKSVTALVPMINKSIQQTVGRSVMTSLTTILVMIPLLILCGSTIRSFILPLLIGVIASTLSSIFVATSIWYDINKVTTKDSYAGKAKKKQAKQKKEKQKAEKQKTEKPTTEKQKAGKQKAENQEPEKQKVENPEKEKQKTEKQKAGKQETEKQESEKQKAEQQETKKQKTKKQEAKNQETANQGSEQQEAEQQETEKQATEAEV